MPELSKKAVAKLTHPRRIAELREKLAREGEESAKEIAENATAATPPQQKPSR